MINIFELTDQPIFDQNSQQVGVVSKINIDPSSGVADIVSDVDVGHKIKKLTLPWSAFHFSKDTNILSLLTPKSVLSFVAN